MRVIRCDRCGREIHPAQINKIGYVALNWRLIDTDDLEDGNPYEHCDFCPDCMEEIKSFIEGKHPAAAEEDAPDPDPAPAKDKKKPGKKAVDKGKVGALWDAGWSIKDIASEMNCSDERVRQILRELGKLNKKEEE